jgi:UDP-glucose 4-epimerase
VINKFVFDANFDKRVSIQGNGKQSRTFIHVEFLAKALNNLLTAELAGGTYNLVDRTVKIFDVVDILKELIPNLEFIFINQHLKLHELSVMRNEELNKTLGIVNSRPLKEELTDFLSKFTF